MIDLPKTQISEAIVGIAMIFFRGDEGRIAFLKGIPDAQEGPKKKIKIGAGGTAKWDKNVRFNRSPLRGKIV